MFQVLSVLQYSLSVSMSTYGILTIVKDSIQRKYLRVVLIHPALEVTHEDLEKLHLLQCEESAGMVVQTEGKVIEEECDEFRERDVLDEYLEVALELIHVFESQLL